MPAQHSQFNNAQVRVISKLPILPLKTKYNGPAPPGAEEDIVDEALRLFKPNVFFRNFEVKGAGDLLLIYLSLYAAQCLRTIAGKPKADAEKLLYTLALENFPLPGDKKFALGGLVLQAATRQEAEVLRQYLVQCRQELGVRLVPLVYKDATRQDKWWMCFAKRKFLCMSLD